MKSDEELDERDCAYIERTETELVQSEEVEVVNTTNAFQFPDRDRDRNRDWDKIKTTYVAPKFEFPDAADVQEEEMQERKHKSSNKFVVPEMVFMRDEHHKAPRIATSRVNAQKTSQDEIASYKNQELVEWIESQEKYWPSLMKYRKNMRAAAIDGHKFLRLTSSSLKDLGVLPSDTAAFMKCIHNINGQKRKHDKKPSKRQRRKVRAAA